MTFQEYVSYNQRARENQYTRYSLGSDTKDTLFVSLSLTPGFHVTQSLQLSFFLPSSQPLVNTAFHFHVLLLIQQQLCKGLEALPLLIQVHLGFPHHVHQDCITHLIQHHFLRQLGTQSAKNGSEDNDLFLILQ